MILRRHSNRSLSFGVRLFELVCAAPHTLRSARVRMHPHNTPDPVTSNDQACRRASGAGFGMRCTRVALPLRVFALRPRSCLLRDASRTWPCRAAHAAFRTRGSSSDTAARSSAARARGSRSERPKRMGTTLCRTSGLESVARTRLRTATTSSTHSSVARHRSHARPWSAASRTKVTGSPRAAKKVCVDASLA